MSKYTIRRTFIVVFGTAVLLAGCQDGEKPQAVTVQPPPSSVGREYGETLHGAINQAHEAKSTLEASSRALDNADE